MTDNERKIRLVEHTVPEGEAKWCNRASALSIPGRPELGLFPSILTWHYGNCRVEHPYVRTVSYFPDISSLRDNPETNELQMKYPSVHDSQSWIAFTVRKGPTALERREVPAGRIRRFDEWATRRPLLCAPRPESDSRG